MFLGPVDYASIFYLVNNADTTTTKQQQQELVELATYWQQDRVPISCDNNHKPPRGRQLRCKEGYRWKNKHIGRVRRMSP